MSRYLQVAEEANKTAKELLDLIPKECQPNAACMIAQLVNYGIRCSPRPVQSTVRQRAVTTAVKGLPVRVTMVKRVTESGDIYNALLTDPVV